MNTLVTFVAVAVVFGSALVESRPQDYVGNGYGRPVDYDPNPRYSFSYAVEEPLTGDFKNHQESRDGDSVQGSYSLVEPDGSHRRVEYVVQGGSGFNAVVTRNGAPVGGQRTVPQPYYQPSYNPAGVFPVRPGYVAPGYVAPGYGQPYNYPNYPAYPY